MPLPLSAHPIAPLALHPHPRLHLCAFTTEFPRRLGDLLSPPGLQARLSVTADVPLHADDNIRTAIRDLLRVGGYKPTGRGKPASEYLLRSAREGALVSINAAVDACNVVSLHSGLPISVVDLDRVEPPLEVRIADADASYVFNPSGQTMALGGLLCLHDDAGPCANAVKDAQRSKTLAATRYTLSIVWGTCDLAEHTEAATRWYREILADLGAKTAPVATTP